MPATPERVWRAIQTAGANQSDATTSEAQPHFDEGAPNQDPASGASTTTTTQGGDQ
jgi:carbon-monoxide dehydrogenase large subunit